MTPIILALDATLESVVRGHARASRVSSVLLDLKDHFDLDRDVEGQFSHADRGASMFTDRLTKNLDHKIGEAIDDLGLIRKSRTRLLMWWHSFLGSESKALLGLC